MSSIITSNKVISQFYRIKPLYMHTNKPQTVSSCPNELSSQNTVNTFYASLAQQYFIILLNKMRAHFTECTPSTAPFHIELICSQMQPLYVEHHAATKKYKKVGKQVRAKLLQCIQKGWSIVNVAKKFNINYSTAKSIVQFQKKKQTRTDLQQHDLKINSTDECQIASSEL